MARGKPSICTSCKRVHWSLVFDTCVDCRKVPPSRRGNYPPSMRVLDHDLARSAAVIRRNNGHCLSGTTDQRKRCQTHWRHLSHRHCPNLGCHRAMSERARQCGACAALEIFDQLMRADIFDQLEYSDSAHRIYLADMQGLPMAFEL